MLGTLQDKEKEKALLAEILAKLNYLFQGDVTDSDQPRFVATVIGKVQGSETLARQPTICTQRQGRWSYQVRSPSTPLTT